jgi:molecular chaperone GrpE
MSDEYQGQPVPEENAEAPPPAGEVVAEPVVEGEIVETEPLPDPVEAESEIEQLRVERDEYLAHLQRTQAEFDNYRKRMLRDQTVHLERATGNLIEQLLPVLDSFELALGSAGTDVERLRKGVELVYGEFLGALEKAGLERIEALGKPFDPEEHEAVMHVEDDGGEPGVRDVVRSGYRFKGRVLRPAMVKVAT